MERTRYYTGMAITNPSPQCTSYRKIFRRGSVRLAEGFWRDLLTSLFPLFRRVSAGCTTKCMSQNRIFFSSSDRSIINLRFSNDQLYREHVDLHRYRSWLLDATRDRLAFENTDVSMIRYPLTRCRSTSALSGVWDAHGEHIAYWREARKEVAWDTDRLENTKEDETFPCQIHTTVYCSSVEEFSIR